MRLDQGPIPDAPYIVEAMMHGMPSREPVYCPCCGKDCETIYAVGSDVFGCEYCVDVMDSDDWAAEGRE